MSIESKNGTPSLLSSLTKQPSYDVLVLDAASRQALVTVRSLGAHRLCIAALEALEKSPVPAFASRWCHQKFVCRPTTGTQGYLSYLEEVLVSRGTKVIIPCSDATVALLRAYRQRIEQHTRIALAKEPALAISVNKEQTLAIAQHLGIAIPRSIIVETVNGLEVALREIGLPAVIKPVESWVGDSTLGVRIASYLVTTPEEARQAVENLTLLGGKTLFQQFLSGERESIAFMYAHGTMHARFAQWAKRTDPPLGGTSVVRQSIPIPSDIGKQAELLVREIELEGYSEVEFRRDSAGRPHLMEINSRLSASLELAVRSGVDFPYLLYQWACGEPIDSVQNYQTGIWMRYLGGDIATTLATLKQHGRPGVASPSQAILDFCASFFVPMRYDYVDWQDPSPALAAIAGFPRYLLQREKKGRNIHG